MSIRTNRQRDDIAERPTPETPEPLEEEARRERAVTDTGRDEHEGPGPVYSPSDAYTDGTTRETGDDAVTDGTADADGDGNRFRQPYGEAGDDVLTSPQTGGRHTAESDRLVAGGRTDDHTDSLTSAERSGDAATGAYGTYGDDADRGPETDGAGYGRDGALAGDTAASGDTVTDTTTGTATDTATGDTVDGPVAYPVTTTASGTASVLDEAFDSRWREIKTGFVDDPRQSVEQADALVEEALSALTSRRQALLDQWKDNEQGDTEALRLALHEYHALLAHLNRK
ncbi:hypothetical protein ACIBK1_32440 [Microbispora rosea]|uniref:hypothetical protein n=1 Tax=Microbispora rosea TaxID=58117 RepID=UPI00068B60E2|nr:hypothetical protein [Microbispora rosea]